VRATSPQEAALEPLPVDDGYGTQLAPVAVALNLTDDLLDAGRLTLAHLQDVAALAPWTHTDDRPELRDTVHPNRSSTFVRMVAFDASRLTALPAWWQRRARRDRVRVTRRFSIEQPHQVDATWRLGGQLRSIRGLRSIPFELALWRHLDGWTMLNLQPHRRVYVGSRYFHEGHRALDILIDWLNVELDPDA
jgi:hypothetical protein